MTTPTLHIPSSVAKELAEATRDIKRARRELDAAKARKKALVNSLKDRDDCYVDFMEYR